MALPFNTAQTILPSEISSLAHTYPAPVEFQGKLYVFYNGNGNDGIWYTSYSGYHWSDVVNVRNHIGNMSVSPGTSPAVVVYDNTVFLFYQGNGHDGTWFVTFDGQSWNGAWSVSERCGGQNFLAETSPAAAVYGGKLYLFWNGSGDNGIYFTTYNGSSWTGQRNVSDNVWGISVRPRTSPAVTVSNGTLWLFFNGRGCDGTWFTGLTSSGWMARGSVNDLIPGGQNFQDGTSPAATDVNGQVLLVWNGSGGDGLWYTVISNASGSPSGTPQVSLYKTIGASPPHSGTNAGVGANHGNPFIFWPDSGQHLQYTSE